MNGPSPFTSPIFRDDKPLWPLQLQLIRVTASTVAGPSGVAQTAGSSVLNPPLHVAYTQQMRTDSNLPRDREPCLAAGVRGYELTPGYHMGRLSGSWNSLPMYEVVEIGTAGPGSITDGRLSTTNAPVSYDNAFLQSRLYYANAIGSRIALFNLSSGLWDIVDNKATSIFIDMPNIPDKMYDIYAYNNSGVVSLEYQTWSNTTNRGYVHTVLDGVLVRGTGTNRAKKYLGSVYIDSDGYLTQNAYTLPIWNYYNRVSTVIHTEMVSSWNYTTNSWRTVSGDGNYKLLVVAGYSSAAERGEYWLDIMASLVFSNTNANVTVSTGVSINDSSTVNTDDACIMLRNRTPAANIKTSALAIYQNYADLGCNKIYWMEKSDATGTTTIYGDDNSDEGFSGIRARWRW